MIKDFKDQLREKRDQKIWRYMKFSDFVGMVMYGKIFFTRADRFRDQWEVCITKTDEMLMKMKPGDKEWARNTFLPNTFINCWSASDHELSLMWNAYAPIDGIVIQSTVQSLMDSFVGGEDVYISPVQYIDVNNDCAIHDYDPNVIWFFVTKPNMFVQEKEIRLVKTFCDKEEFSVNVDMMKLVKSIRVSPNSPGWKVEMVREVIEKLGLHGIEVVKSDLSTETLNCFRSRTCPHS